MLYFIHLRYYWLEDELLQNAKSAWVGVECEELLATPGHSASSQRFRLALSTRVRRRFGRLVKHLISLACTVLVLKNIHDYR